MQQHARWLAADRYEVGEVVGRGGYGMVCRGLDRKTGREVALKMLSPEAGRDANVVERMLREQQALLALAGTCAVTAIDLCRLESGAPCLVMEWLDGRDLEQQLSAWEAAGQLGDPELLLSILLPLTQTLATAHEIGLVHRDIKPANIFLTTDAAPGVRLLDFGLSRMKSAAPLTAIGMVMGSPSYIAPETWRGNSALLDGRADLFALAVIVFRWLTGNLPFDVPDLIGKMTAVTSGPRPSVVALRPELPPAVDAWMARALAVEADDRFQTGGDFYAAFAAALRGEVWPTINSDVSGVRRVADAPERKSALASAWSAASSLLKRFTAPRERPTAPPPGPIVPTRPVVLTPAPRVEAAEDRASVWLDSDELEDASSPVAAPPPLATPAAGAAPEPSEAAAASEAVASDEAVPAAKPRKHRKRHDKAAAKTKSKKAAKAKAPKKAKSRAERKARKA